MRSNIQVKQNNFKVIIEKFRASFEAIKNKLQNFVKNRKT